VIDWSEHDEYMTGSSDAGINLSLDRTGRRPQIKNVTSNDCRADLMKGHFPV